MMRTLTALLSISFILFFISCYDTKQTYNLNPDGSGKVVIDLVFQPFSFGDDKKDPQKKLKSSVLEILEKSKGVDAWKDVTWLAQDDGRIRFNGTAYFSDLGKLNLSSGGMLKASLTQGEKNTLVLEVKGDSEGKGMRKKSEEPAAAMSAEEKTKAALKAKNEFQQARSMLAGFLASLRHESTFQLPGTVKSAVNLKTGTGGTLTILVEGKKLVEAFDSVATNTAFFERQVEKGTGGDLGDDFFNEKMFGSKGPIRAVLSGPFTPRFDYAAELASARAAEKTIYQALGKAEPAAPATGGTIKAAHVAGVMLVGELDTEREIYPLGQWKGGYSISVIVDFPGSVLKIDKVRLEEARTDLGQDLLLEDESERKASFPKLSKDKTSAVCDFKLKNPDANAKSISKLSGKLEYYSASKTKTVELDFPSVSGGAKSKIYTSEIKTVKPAAYEKDKMEIALAVGLSQESIREYQVLDASGKPVEMEKGMESSYGGTTDVTLRVKGKIPDKAKIVLVLWEEMKKYEVPFSLAPFTLLGQAVK